jgi:hypothetical protein
MAETLSFKTLFQYDTRSSGITIPVRLEWGGRRTECKANALYRQPADVTPEGAKRVEAPPTYKYSAPLE